MNPPRVPAAAQLPPEADEVGRLIAKGNAKSALEAAKLLHKRVGTPASEQLLVTAYGARILAMLEHRMTAEAEALIRLVRERHPAYASRLDSLQGELTGAGAGLAELVRPLADATVAAEVRASIEQTLRSELTDPAALAACTGLPADHPLRRAADAVSRALQAVTSGKVEDSALALPEVSRRSPLAPWKPLVRAIASYYRHDDGACREHLRAIEPGSAPARLVPVLEVLVGAGDTRKLKPAGTTLTAQVGGSFGALREALQSLDVVFREEGPKAILAAIRATVSLVQQQCPEMLPDFRRKVAVLAVMEDLSPTQLAGALGGAVKTDARFQLMTARALEMGSAPPSIAGLMWEQFRCGAIQERWFPARGPEMAVVYLHMAKVAAEIDPEDIANEHREMLREISRDAFDPEVQGSEPDLSYLHADVLFARAAEMDPSPEVFEAWIQWGIAKDQRNAQTAAEAWRKAVPNDPRPLLHLMRLAEERNALKKALGYLRQAEELDGVNAEVRRARMRLLILGAVRHLKQGKPRLADPELDELEALPQARENDRPAFVACLRHVAAILSNQEAEALAISNRVRSLLGGQMLTAGLAVTGVAWLCEAGYGVETAKCSGSWLEAIPRVCEMGWDLGITLTLPLGADKIALQELGKAEAGTLERFGRTAIRLGWKECAFAVAGAGLAAGKGREARFLLLRAMSYMGRNYERWEDCLAATITLARVSGDSGLAEEATQHWRENSVGGSFGGEPPSLTAKQLKSVVKRERTARQLQPDYNFAGMGLDLDDFDFELPFPRRRGRRRARPMNDEPELPF